MNTRKTLSFLLGEPANIGALIKMTSPFGRPKRRPYIVTLFIAFVLVTVEELTNLQNKSEEPGTREMLLQSPGLIRIFLNFNKQFFFRGPGKSSRGGAAKGLPARAQQPGGEHGRGRAATGPRPKLA